MLEGYGVLEQVGKPPVELRAGVGVYSEPELGKPSFVQGVFDEDGRCGDPGIETRIRGVATQLIDYIRGNICPRLALEEMVRREVERRVA